MPILIQSGRFSSAFSPLSLSPAMWVDPSDSGSITLNVSAVSQANDKSGNTRHLVQATGTAQPAYTSAGINGLNCFTFDGTSDFLRYSGNVIAQPNTIMFVGQTTAVEREMVDGTTAFANRQVLYRTAGNKWELYAGSSLTSAANADASLHVFCAVANGASSKIYVDGGAALASGNAGSQPLDAGLTYGARYNNATYVTGAFGELVVFASTSLTDINALGSYLATKWGLAWTTAT